ncbi:hypothetical protein [Corynebacterium pygosceleis]|uniref:Uncharacterized protein n=1 Tax=Corynebacterium pygosceleis TaxID=2800406 RepID=A0A9Q4C7G2_9CORY|nr:hypothetical protein [Corynebacterium pygosceleis]MCK7637564.1 hypothetical protein [Corynebacterium pygosceleis]MCK7674755.1 hypothetical protein [Corynebacterium pygosceleis]MCL0119656.1 hypothetical protein [Corynebacterium pygosceleis]MCX7468107.1 hypothetical protein [Corynebacterium pygosceleis]
MDNGHTPGSPAADDSASVLRLDPGVVEALKRLLDDVEQRQARHAAMVPEPVGEHLGTGFRDFAVELDRQFLDLHAATAHRLEAIRATVSAALVQVDEFVSGDRTFGDELRGILR